MRETWVPSWIGKIPWRRESLPTPVFWLGEFHGMYRPWVTKSQTRLNYFHSHFLHPKHWITTPSISILKVLRDGPFMGFSRQEYWSSLPFPSPVDHILSELSTITCLSWMALHGMAHSFTELDKAVVYVIRLVSSLWWWFSFCLALWWRRLRGLWKLPDGRDWLRGNWVLFWWAGPCSINL